MPFGIGFEWDAPEKMSVVGRNSEQCIGGEGNDLLGAREGGYDQRRIGRFVILRFPENFARAFVEANQAGAVLTSHRHDNGFAMNHARAVVAAAAGGAFVGFAAEKFYA